MKRDGAELEPGLMPGTSEKMQFPTGRMSLKSLAPEDARLALSVHRFVRDELGVDWRRRGLVVALSGGADSTALLVLLCALRDHLGLTLTAAHLDHGLRPESAAEAEAARVLCRRLEVPCVVERRDVSRAAAQGSLGLEAAARRERYAFLERVRREREAVWVVTGHHAGDLAEDVLLRLVRGASWPGLGGMRGLTAMPYGGAGMRENKEQEATLLRPLLMLEKNRLVTLLQRLGIGWSEDASNGDRMFRRNRMRLDVLPLLLAENPDFLDVVRGLWRTARLDEAYWREQTRPVLHVDESGTWLPRAALAELSRPARLRAYVEAVRGLGTGQARASTLFALDDAWKNKRHGRCFQLPGGIRAELDAEGVRFIPSGCGESQ